MRFDAQEYVDTWKSTGRYPAIHDDMFTAVQAFMQGKSALDLCCSTGLLGNRIMQKLGVRCIGVDGDLAALALGDEAGLMMPLIDLAITPDTMKDLYKLCQAHKIDTVIARSCMPELFGQDLSAGRKFAENLAKIGVKEIFLEGRVATKNSVNQLATLKNEVELFPPHYKVVRVHKNVAYLRTAH